jgi:hypothetical protein
LGEEVRDNDYTDIARAMQDLLKEYPDRALANKSTTYNSKNKGRIDSRVAKSLIKNYKDSIVLF